jgi:signal transduction histidine kinase
VAQRDPSKAALRDELMAFLSVWDQHPLWQERLTAGYQLLTEVSANLLRRLTANEEHYQLLSKLGVRSLMVMPLAARGEIRGIVTCAYTGESGRRYGRDDPALAEEFALHAANAFEHARLMKDLKASEARFRIALASAQTIVFEQDASLRYVWAHNPRLPFSMVGKTHEEAFRAEEAAALTQVKQKVLDEGERLDWEMDFNFGDERRHYRETIEPLRDSSGAVVGLIGAATDITEQDRMRKQLTEELGFRERMMGILGHDLRNPLSAIAMAAELLMRTEDLTSDKVQSQSLRILRSASRMKEMIETLLGFTQVRSGGEISASPIAADLGEISRSAIEELRIVWPDRSIELEIRGDPRGIWDPSRLAQTVSNLVSNALSFGDRGHPVRVSVDGAGPDVALSVHNAGTPIPAAAIPVLFQPFRRGVLEDKSPRGLGLGLYIADQIVRAHAGTISVESSETEGTTFTVRLPRSRDRAGRT